MKNYFTIEELCQSEVAEMNNIDNTPDQDIENNLNELINFLNPMREAWGSAILVNSGYRCDKLNEMVGGSDTSVHKIGFAVDLFPKNGEIEKFKIFIENYLKTNCQWDQLLFERNKHTQWVHIGLYNNYMQQRMQIKYIVA